MASDVMRLRYFSLLALLPLLACGRSEPPAVELAVQIGVPYRVLLKTFQDGAYADQPFHLLVQTRGGAFEPKTVLRAEQCKNVTLAQTSDTLYVFYDELALTSFTSFESETSEPTILLCDVQASTCADVQRQLTKAGTKLTNLCSYRT